MNAREQRTADRVALLKKLHDIMLNMSDENAYFDWIIYMPDEPTEEDFEDIAESRDYLEYLEEFIEIFRTYYKVEQKGEEKMKARKIVLADFTQEEIELIGKVHDLLYDVLMCTDDDEDCSVLVRSAEDGETIGEIEYKKLDSIVIELERAF